MLTNDAVAGDAPAKVLALILSAGGALHGRALDRLEASDAFGRLGVSRSRFLELARECSGHLAPGLCEHSWLSDADTASVEALLDAVGRLEDRQLVCRLAAAALENDGLVAGGARLVLEHALGHWRIEPTFEQPPGGRRPL